MEDTLRAEFFLYYQEKKRVLILVLMEDTLRGIRMPEINIKHKVLILVLMEDTLRVNNKTYGNIDTCKLS